MRLGVGSGFGCSCGIYDSCEIWRWELGIELLEFLLVLGLVRWGEVCVGLIGSLIENYVYFYVFG